MTRVELSVIAEMVVQIVLVTDRAKAAGTNDPEEFATEIMDLVDRAHDMLEYEFGAGEPQPEQPVEEIPKRTKRERRHASTPDPLDAVFKPLPELDLDGL